MNIHSINAMGQPKKLKLPTGPDKREAILDAAVTLFAERGYHGTPMPLLAERAGVGAGTMYRYFPSKEELVNVLFRNWKGLLFTTLVEDFRSDAPARQQFHELWTRLAKFAMKHPDGFTFLELHHHAPYLTEESREVEQRVLMLVHSYVVQAQRDMILKPIRPEVMIAMAWGAFVGLMKAAALGYLRLEKDVLDETEELMWQALRI
jgi:AcrR family transcriptional regulator